MARSVDELGVAVAAAMYADARWGVCVEVARSQLKAAAWGARYNLGVAYLAAHLTWEAVQADAAAADASAGATAGASVTSRGAGDLSESYGDLASGSSTGAISAEDALYMGSNWGRAFVRLRRGLAAGRARVVDCGV